MGDYVLESNPALERLIERHRAQGVPPPPAESPRSRGHTKRSRRGKRSKAEVADHPEVLLGDSGTSGTTGLAERTTDSSPRDITEEDARVVEGNIWAIDEDSQAADEMLLIDFDEEPEVFDEDLAGSDEDEDDDEADEVLDLYEEFELDDEDQEEDVNDHVHAEFVVAGAEVADGNGLGGRDWIFDAFEAWKLEVVEAAADDRGVAGFDDDAETESIDVWWEDTEDPVPVTESGRWPFG